MKKSADSVQHTDSIQEQVVLRLKEVGLILLGALCFYFLMALLSYHSSDPGWSSIGQSQSIANAAGRSGAMLADILFTLFGYFAYIFPVALLASTWGRFIRRRQAADWHPLFTLVKLIGLLLLMVAGAAMANLHFSAQAEVLPEGAGGVLGTFITGVSLDSLGRPGLSLIMSSLFLVGLTIFAEISWFALMDKLGAAALGLFRYCSQSIALFRERLANKRVHKLEHREIEKNREERKIIIESDRKRQELRKPVEIKVPAKPAPVSLRVEKEKQVSLFEEGTVGKLPPINLLDPAQKNPNRGFSAESLEAMSRLLELKLKDFGVIAEVVAVHPGPVVTRFEIQPAAGVKVSKISNLAKDLARSLAVISVRVVEVIPGKSVVGIEIPNEDREIVYFSEVVGSKVFDDAKSAVTVALGHDIGGTPIVADLARMPHLLVAGTTGSGKSVGVNAMILSMLLKSTPEELRLVMVDPKMLELSIYDGIPHLLTPVVTDMKDAANALRWCVAEMDRRYKLMSKMGVRNVAGYNRKVKDAIEAGEPLKDPLHEPISTEDLAPDLETLPFIVVVVDEFADMIMIVGKKVEELIARIAQKARAAGIHLILATQRPSVDVITGLIKANVPTRIAFQVSSRIDSRTILDQGGAEQLLGHGDMLYLPPGTAVPVRVHGAFVSDEEVHRVVADWRKRGEPVFVDEILNGVSESDSSFSGADGGGEEADALYDEALAFVTESRRASISAVQRKLRVGYNRAANLIEAMEAAGVVSSMGTNGSREVLAPPPVKI